MVYLKSAFLEGFGDIVGKVSKFACSHELQNKIGRIWGKEKVYFKRMRMGKGNV
jgi:hypothetical protein